MNHEIFTKLTTGDFNARLFSFMRQVGLDRIIVNYSGGGDSGGMDSMSFVPAIDEKIESAIQESLEEDLCNPIYSRHGSFADGGGYSVHGHVIWDAKQDKVWLEGVDHHYEYDEDGEESDERDEEWHEPICDEPDYNSKEKDYFFVCFYAEHVLKSKLPEEFHNRILLEATNGDEAAEKYIKCL